MPGYTDKDVVLEKMRKFCSYRERCHAEVRSKLIGMKIYGQDLEEVIAELIRENYLNEERFAKAFARGKFRNNKWGRKKILQGLKSRHVSAYCIKKAMEEIDEEAYRETLELLMLHKAPQLKGDQYKRLNALSTYCIRKGYEPHIVYALAKKVIGVNA